MSSGMVVLGEGASIGQILDEHSGSGAGLDWSLTLAEQLEPISVARFLCPGMIGAEDRSCTILL